MDLSVIIAAAAIVSAVFILIKLIKAPLKFIFKLLINMVTGFLLLLLTEFICGFFDFSVGISLVNCLVAGVFGLPGVIILVVLKLLIL